jgi:hypothetical protein
VVSSWADLVKAAADPDPDGTEIAFAVAGAGLDTLGAVADPFHGVAATGLGWLIEHVTFLREPLDALAGDPQQVIAQAQTWSNVARELRGAVADHAASDVSGWTGAAGEAYRSAAERYRGSVLDVAGQADRLAHLVLVTGAAVGTVRALIRDLIADFLISVARAWLMSLATATVTAGMSSAAAITAVALDAYRLARTITEHISRLLDVLSHAAGTAGALVDGMRRVAAEARATAPYMLDSLDQAPLAPVVEAGKQFSSTSIEEHPASS